MYYESCNLFITTYSPVVGRREAMRQTVVGDTNNKEKSKKGKQLLCAKKHQKKKKKRMLYSNYNDGKFRDFAGTKLVG